jgi:hypothetical protein
MQFARRLFAGKARRVAMTSSNSVILLEVIATGATCGVLFALHFVHFICRRNRWSGTEALYRALSLGLLQFLYHLLDVDRISVPATKY